MDKEEDKKPEDELKDLDDLNLEDDSSKKDEDKSSDDKKDDDSKDESSSSDPKDDSSPDSESGSSSSTSTDTATPSIVTQDSPADALSRDPEDLAEELALNDPKAEKPKKPKKFLKLKAFLRKINVYFLFFILIVVVAGAVTVVMYLNSQQEPEDPEVAVQEISQEVLQQLANNDVSIGDTSQTLTIQGSAVIEGQALMRGNLSVAGNIQSGGSLQGSSLTIPGESNLGETQINNLQVATDLAIQGNTSLRDLSTSGSASFGGAVTASQLTVTNLILSRNSTLEVPNHISFTGPSPSRSINAGALGGGGSASVNGSDSAGTVNINTGGGSSAGCMVRIGFNQAYSKQPYVLISPVGAGAANTSYYVERDQNGFSICSASAPPANQSFAFDYFVMS